MTAHLEDGQGVVVQVGSPDASAEEVAAIVAAVEVTWPRPHPHADRVGESRWRFSGRWWSKPVPVRRDRPW